MSFASVFVALVGLVASLYLAVRGLRGFRLSVGQMAAMGAFWAAIIFFLGFVLGRVV